MEKETAYFSCISHYKEEEPDNQDDDDSSDQTKNDIAGPDLMEVEDCVSYRLSWPDFSWEQWYIGIYVETDLRWRCQQNNTLIFRSVNLTTEEK